VPVELTQVYIADGAARGAAHPEETIAGSNRCADRRREQHRHTRGLPGVPRGYKARSASSTICDTWRHVAACLDQAARGAVDTVDVAVPPRMVLGMEGVACRPK
jgi:hypothetical protein